MPRINVIDYPESNGRLREIYDQLLEKRGKLADVHKIQSLRPESIVHHMDLYLEIMFSRSPLSRAEREMMAVVVSVANGCIYCQTHHAEALNHYWKDKEKLDKLIRNDAALLITPREQSLCRYAHSLTIEPEKHEKRDFTLELKKAGLDDHAILDATLVIAYFNFVNRIVLSLGLEVEKDQGKGYKY